MKSLAYALAADDLQSPGPPRRRLPARGVPVINVTAAMDAFV